MDKRDIEPSTLMTGFNNMTVALTVADGATLFWARWSKPPKRPPNDG
jgi:hypothetical protein